MTWLFTLQDGKLLICLFEAWKSNEIQPTTFTKNKSTTNAFVDIFFASCWLCCFSSVQSLKILLPKETFQTHFWNLYSKSDSDPDSLKIHTVLKTQYYRVLVFSCFLFYFLLPSSTLSFSSQHVHNLQYNPAFHVSSFHYWTEPLRGKHCTIRHLPPTNDIILATREIGFCVRKGFKKLRKQWEHITIEFHRWEYRFISVKAPSTTDIWRSPVV